MRFIVDAQLPPALARWLSSQGHEAIHVADHQMETAKDSEIWSYAITHHAVIVTKDEDFALRHSMEKLAPSVVWIRVGNTSKAALLGWFETMLPNIITALQRGETLIEVV